MDTRAGASPFGHAFLLFSSQKSEHSPIEVGDAYGYYSQPSSSTHPIVRAIKYILGISYNLQDTHGSLIREKIRYLSSPGLKSLDFNISEEQYKSLITKCQHTIEVEQAAIKENNQSLYNQRLPQNGHTRLLFEQANENPRLQKFHIGWEWSKTHAIDMSPSYTCKHKAADLLLEEGVIDEQTKKKILGSKQTLAFPCFTHEAFSPIRLVSTGKVKKQLSKDETRIFFNRTWDNNQLFWTTRPNIRSFENLDHFDTTHKALANTLDKIHKMELTLLERISKLEGDTVSSSGNIERRKNNLQGQLERVQSLYSLFSIADKNMQPKCLARYCLTAEKTLNAAELTLNPDKINHSFIYRAVQSASSRHALFGMLTFCLSIAAAMTLTPWAALISAPTLVYTGYKLHGFYKEEVRHAEMKADYLAFKDSCAAPTA